MRKYLPLYIIVLIFMMPAISSVYILYFTDKNNFSNTAHGTFVNPAQKITNSSIAPQKWNVLFSDSKDQTIMRNMHIALGPDQNRVSIAQTELQYGAIIVDPQSMYIMHYSDPIDITGLLKDLRKLLKYSHAK